MSERERWIVYPLLFLALGAALRDKLLKKTESDSVVSKQFIVRNDAGDYVAVLNKDGIVCNQILVRDSSGKITAVLNEEGLQTTRSVTATLVDAQRIQQAGRAISAGGRGGTFSLPLQQLIPMLRGLQGAQPPATQAPAGSAPAAIAPGGEPPPEVTIPGEPADQAPDTGDAGAGG